MNQAAEDQVPEIAIHGVAISRCTAEQAIATILRRSIAGVGGHVITPNLDILRRVTREPDFAELYSAADLKLADGMPLVWASRIRGTPLPGRVAGSDLIWSLSEAAAAEKLSVFLLGGNPGAAAAAASILQHRYSALTIAGTLVPPFGFEQDPREFTNIVEGLRAADPDLVFVALGSPKQEVLIHRLRVEFPSVWFLGVGISFSFVSGEVSRAPVWVRRIGMEWIHRLLQEPSRLWKRYLLQGLPFAVLVFFRALRERSWRWKRSGEA